jgi:hypothetical protein
MIIQYVGLCVPKCGDGKDFGQGPQKKVVSSFVFVCVSYNVNGSLQPEADRSHDWRNLRDCETQ